jgi:hypothetical protein
MARRLRTVLARLADGDRECALFEGRSAISQCALHVLGVEPIDRGHGAAFLASAASALVRDEICKPDAIIAWGEAAAAVLPAIQATSRVFVLPTGTWGPPLSAAERAALDPNAPDLAMAKGSLAGLGAIDADVVVFPSPSSARRFEGAREFSFRASDQPVVSVRFGCDEAPCDPATDPALAAGFSLDAPAGKADCRKALARRTSLALGRRTLLVATAPLAIAEGWPRAYRRHFGPGSFGCRVRGAGHWRTRAGGRDQAHRHRDPGQDRHLPRDGAGGERQILAGADVLLLADKDNHLARTAGLAMRYATLPLVPDCAAYADYMVDYDVASQTGNGLLYQPADAYEQVSVVLRAAGLRGNPDVWQPLQNRLMHAAPHWAATAALFEGLCLYRRDADWQGSQFFPDGSARARALSPTRQRPHRIQQRRLPWPPPFPKQERSCTPIPLEPRLAPARATPESGTWSKSPRWRTPKRGRPPRAAARIRRWVSGP